MSKLEITYQKKYTTLRRDAISLTYSKLLMGNMSSVVGDTQNAEKHREEYFKLLPDKPIVRMKCTHKTTIIDVDDLTLDGSFTEVECDGFIADISKVSLLMLPANCAPVALYVPGSNIVGYAHLSRQTSSQRLGYSIARRYIQKTACSPEDIRVLIGPCVHSESYIFPPEIAAKLFDDSWNPFLRGVRGGVSVNLPAMICSQLVGAGIKKENVFVHPDDTSSGEYFAQSKSSDLKFDGRNAAAVHCS